VIAGRNLVGAAILPLASSADTVGADRATQLGMKVIKDTPVRTEARARAIGNAALVAAVASTVVGTAAMWRLYGLAVTLLRR